MAFANRADPQAYDETAGKKLCALSFDPVGLADPQSALVRSPDAHKNVIVSDDGVRPVG